jgi:hypothetical protein
MWISPAGTKNAVYVHEDAVWITIHLNPENLTDIDALEEQLVTTTYETIDNSKTRT